MFRKWSSIFLACASKEANITGKNQQQKTLALDTEIKLSNITVINDHKRSVRVLSSYNIVMPPAIRRMVEGH